MAIQLEYNEAIISGLKRVLIEQCKEALKYIQKADTDDKRHEAVHLTRKAFQKIRAGIRLVRDHMPSYGEVNVFFRDEGRKLSDIRDASANLETLDKLEAQYAEGFPDQSFDHFREMLLEYREELAKEVFREDSGLIYMAQDVEEQVPYIKEVDMDVNDFSDILPGIRKVYSRGRKAMKKARSSGEEQYFHLWRKRAKYLRYQLDILRRIWPAVLSTLESELHTLTDLAGMSHDLQVLRETLAKLDTETLEQPIGLHLQALLDKHQEFVRTHALLLGERIYELPPKAFCNLLEVYWKRYAEEIEQTGLPPLDQLKY
ncbi:MAG: CHAD domain-containing protein [Lewinella sp.]|nr:CHAD domain-containing protein [Lewinella sp.]